MNATHLLVRALLAVLVLGAVYATVSVAVVRRLGKSWGWLVGALSFGVLLIYVLSLTAGFPSDLSLPLRSYMVTAFLGLPLAVCTWVTGRGCREAPGRSFYGQVALGLGAFLAAVPLGFILALIPDALVLFR